jgi:hypothetical protein
MIAAGVNAKALSAFIGHASITITLDRYGRLFPGSEDDAAGLLSSAHPGGRYVKVVAQLLHCAARIWRRASPTGPTGVRQGAYPGKAKSLLIDRV